MYISIRDALVTHAGASSTVEGLRELGLASVEVEVDRNSNVRSLEHPNVSYTLDSAEGIADYRCHLRSLGVSVCAFLLANNFNAPDKDAEVAWVVSVVEAAGKLAVPAVRIDSAMTGQEELDLKTRVKIFSDALSLIVSETEAFDDVKLGIENHGTQGNDPEFLDGVFQAVGSHRLGMTLDTGNFYWSGMPLSKVYEVLEHFAPLTKHTHVKNINYPESERQKQRPRGWEYGKYVSPLDEGDIQFQKLVDILRAVGYAGDLTIEDESLGKYPAEERFSILKRDIQHIKSVL